VPESEGRALIERLVSAINRHDLDGIVAVCHPDVRGELPAHPARNYVGDAMMRANWAMIFEAVPDLVAELTRSSVDGELVWTEWCWYGTQADGARFERAGVAIHGLRDGRIEWVRLYMQPVTGQPAGAIDAAMREMGRNVPEH
jgi:ketosteroid isomerase-like protein